MTAPYFPDHSWRNDTLARLPKQTDMLDRVLGRRFQQPQGGAQSPYGGAPAESRAAQWGAQGGSQGGAAGQQQQQQQQPPPSGLTAQSGAPVGSTPMWSPPPNPFRPAAPAQAGGMGAGAGGFSAGQQQQQQAGPAQGAGGAAGGAAGAGNGQNGVMGQGDSSTGGRPPEGSWIEWAQENHPKVAQYFGYLMSPEGLTDAPRQALEAFAATVEFTPGSDAWWQALESWADSEEGQAALQIDWGDESESQDQANRFNTLAERDPSEWTEEEREFMLNGPWGELGRRIVNQPSEGLDSDLSELVRSGLANPSRYTRDFVGDMWRSRAEDLDNQFGQAGQRLNERLSQQGIRDSTFGGAEHLRLSGIHRDAQTQALQDLMESVAASMSEDRSRAVNDALAFRGAREGSRQFDMNFDLARRFGEEDRGFRDRQFDWQREYDTERFNADQQRWQDQMYQFLLSMGLI